MHEIDKSQYGRDMQQARPQTEVCLSRVGLTNLKRIIRLRSSKGEHAGKHETLFFAEMNLFADLEASHAGVHMSRFVENIEDIAAEMAAETAPTIESLAERMALAIAQTQGAARSEIRIRAQFPMQKQTPVSRVKVENLYTFIGIAASDGTKTRHAVGVEVQGFTACPCAREMSAEYSRNALVDAGYSQKEAEKIVGLLPLASHNQRGTGTLILGTAADVEAEDLVRIVESSMSSEIYSLMKRADEFYVVKRGHENPRFVEDVARMMIRNLTEAFPHLPDDTFILSQQENYESIHQHNAFAERGGLLGDIRRELAGENAPCKYLSLESWLERPL